MAFNAFVKQGSIVRLTKLSVYQFNASLITTPNDRINVWRQGSKLISSCSYKRSLKQHESIAKCSKTQISNKLLTISITSCQRIPTSTNTRSLYFSRLYYSTLNSSVADFRSQTKTVVCLRPRPTPVTNDFSSPNKTNINNINLGSAHSFYPKKTFSKQYFHQTGTGIGLHNGLVDSFTILSRKQIFLGHSGQLRCMTQGSLEPQNQSKAQSENKGSIINGTSKINESGEKKDGITPSNGPPETPKKLSLYQRFKQTYKEHGKILIGVHLVTSAAWFGSFYVAARSGLDIVPYLENWNVSEKVISPFRSGGLGFVAVAYLLYKLATPARYAVTIGGTNLVIRYLRKEGKLKQIPKEDSLRSLYKEGKEDFKRKSKVRIKRLRRKSKLNGKGPQNDK